MQSPCGPRGKGRRAGVGNERRQRGVHRLTLQSTSTASRRTGPAFLVFWHVPRHVRDRSTPHSFAAFVRRRAAAHRRRVAPYIRCRGAGRVSLRCVSLVGMKEGRRPVRPLRTHRQIKVCDISTKLCWVEKYIPGEYYHEPSELPNPRPTQPKKTSEVKRGIFWATFSHSKYFFVGWDWFYIGNRIQET